MAEATRRSILSEAWRIARPYWVSEERWTAIALLATVIGLNLAQVWVTVRLNSWRNDFYNTLQDYDEKGFLYQIGFFSVIVAANVVFYVFQVYLQQMLQIRWRRWMTDVYLREWLGNQTYYRLQVEGERTDNPDQRIAEDLANFPSQTLSLGLGLLSAVVQAVSFAVILWNLSGDLPLQLGPLGEWHVPGYMCWGVLVYILLGTWWTIALGKPLVGLNFDQQRYEADFRFALVRLRENTESIAFFGGEKRELATFLGRFGRVVGNYYAIMLRTRLLNFFVQSYMQAAVVFPYLMMAPRYFREHLRLGDIQQTADAFLQLQSSLAFIISSYQDIANWQAIVARLATFRDRVGEIEAARAGPQPIAIARNGAGVAVEGLELALPHGQMLRSGPDFSAEAGERLLVTGPTGAGKSTLLRALAGIWPWGKGRVRIGEGREFFLPQKAYIPLGTLRAALAYPADGAGMPAEKLAAVLEKVGLGYLKDELETEDFWAQRLSGGEQQRLGFARLLLAEPSIVFLDEATAALDEAGEALLYRLVEELPSRPTVVSVGHRSTLRAFHDRVLELGRA